MPIDSISVNRIKICREQNKNIGERLRTKGTLNIDIRDIEKELVDSLKKTFNYVDYELKNDAIVTF